MGLLFGVAALAKFMMGLGTTANFITGMFKETWLPSALVVPYAYALPFAEALIAVWLLTGIKLRAGWIFTAFVLVSLAFGVVVTKQPTAADNYIYVAIACMGLYFSRYDQCVLGGKK